jgi:hypothetical protein
MRQILGDSLSLASAGELTRKMTKEFAKTRFVERDGLAVMKGGYKSTKNVVDDPTGVECLLNKWHVEDFLETSDPSEFDLATLGWSFTKRLKEIIDLASLTGDLRLIMSVSQSLDTPPVYTCTVHFHKVRPNNPWLDEDLENYKDEAIAVIDWNQK